MLDFDKGMTPKPLVPNSATRIEHFDTIDGKLRPFRTLISSPNNQGVATTALALSNFELLNDVIYGVGVDWATPANGAIYSWDTSGFQWFTKLGFGAASVPNAMLHAHAGFLFGLRNSRYIYKMTTGGAYTASFHDTGAAFVNGFSDPITHSKDGKCYIPFDNKIYSIDSTGVTPALALTLPNANFLIKSICEEGNFINICGYDVTSGVSSALLWDRDTSVTDLTESYQLGVEQVYHSATLGGITFFVMLRKDVTNTNFQEKPVLVIKYINGNKAEIAGEFPVTSFANTGHYIGGKYTSNDRLYFTGLVKFDGESAARNIVFVLDKNGTLKIAQNASINTGTLLVTGLIRNGEGFWLGAGSDGAWNTTTTYTTISSYETSDIRSPDLSLALQFGEGFVTCEPLPASGQIIVKARKNEETTFTTIETFTGTNRMKFKISPLKAVNALTGIDNARLVRFRLESTVGATITGFQADFNYVPDKNNG